MLCLIEKAGSTAWEALLAHDHELPPVHSSLAGSVAAARPPVLTIVRNPYARFLSAYLDKAAPHKRGITFNGTFAEFAVHLASCKPQPGEWTGSCPSRDVHFAPQLSLCHLSAGFRYDLVLRIEEMPIWYEAVIDLMGLRVAAQSYGKGKDPTACFFHPPNVSCDEIFRTGEPRSYSSASFSHADSHATYASEKMLDEYTPLAARAATTLYRADVLQFGYRLWDGIVARSSLCPQRYCHRRYPCLSTRTPTKSTCDPPVSVVLRGIVTHACAGVPAPMVLGCRYTA